MKTPPIIWRDLMLQSTRGALIFVMLCGSGIFIFEFQNDFGRRTNGLSFTMIKTDVESDLTTSSVERKGPQIAWLLSFPNSGTSYTGELVRTVTGLNTATNYGQANLLQDGTSQLVFNESMGGPFWTDPKSNIATPTGGYILTKTHCGGRCDRCAPEDYVENHQLFLKDCLETSYVASRGMSVSVGSYDRELVARAIHLIRDPFDNIISRFHLRHNRNVKLNDTQSLEKYPRSREGFRAYCDTLSEAYDALENQSKFFRDIHEFVASVPCHADFFRYIQWHNLAFVTTWDLNIPTLIIHYENYTTNFNQTIDDLMDFLEQRAINESPTFEEGKTYRDYFDDHEITAVIRMFKTLALTKTWYHVKHYFD